MSDIAKRENLTERYVSRVLHLSFLSPAMITKTLEGNQSKYISLQKLQKVKSLNWGEQERIINN